MKLVVKNMKLVAKNGYKVGIKKKVGVEKKSWCRKKKLVVKSNLARHTFIPGTFSMTDYNNLTGNKV